MTSNADQLPGENQLSTFKIPTSPIPRSSDQTICNSNDVITTTENQEQAGTIIDELYVVLADEVNLLEKKSSRRVGDEWTAEEDIILRNIMNVQREMNWYQIADIIHRKVQGSVLRTGSQCNKRWNRVADPSIKKGRWTRDEDKLLVISVNSNRPKNWKGIASQIPGRTDIQVRYRLLTIGKKLVQMHQISANCLPE